MLNTNHTSRRRYEGQSLSLSLSLHHVHDLLFHTTPCPNQTHTCAFQVLGMITNIDHKANIGYLASSWQVHVPTIPYIHHKANIGYLASSWQVHVPTIPYIHHKANIGYLASSWQVHVPTIPYIHHKANIGYLASSWQVHVPTIPYIHHKANTRSLASSWHVQVPTIHTSTTRMPGKFLACSCSWNGKDNSQTCSKFSPIHIYMTSTQDRSRTQSHPRSSFKSLA